MNSDMKRMSVANKERLVAKYFAEDWARDKAEAMLYDYESLRGIGAQRAQPALPEKPSDELSLQLLRSMEIAKAINRGGVPPIDFDAQPAKAES